MSPRDKYRLRSTSNGMKQSAIAICLSLFVLMLGVVNHTAQAQTTAPNILNTINQPFTNFLQDASKINLQDSGNTLENSKNWFEEKTGLNVADLIQQIGNILIAILTLIGKILQGIVSFLQWALSLVH